jgi:hypothetical protein
MIKILFYPFFRFNQTSYLRRSPRQVLASIGHFTFGGMDLPLGRLFIPCYSIQSRAAACLKHSSLFKVNMLCCWAPLPSLSVGHQGVKEVFPPEKSSTHLRIDDEHPTI